ncbi:hypothetical protein ABZ086_36630, partial [Streptomyces halstedii]
AIRWERVVDRVQLGRVSADVVDRFIWQSWNSRREAVKEPELFKEISRLVGSSPAAHLAYLEELERDAETYQWLEAENVQVQPKSRGERNAFAIPEFVDSVRALALFNVSVANSTAHLALLGVEPVEHGVRSLGNLREEGGVRCCCHPAMLPGPTGRMRRLSTGVRYSSY